MSKLSGLLFCLFLFFFIACKQSATDNQSLDGLSAFSADSMKQHIEVLASDSFMGRKPFTEGETKTVAYLQEEFRKAGLEPGNNGSFVQDVPMVNIMAKAAPEMTVKAPKSTFRLKAFNDYIIWTDKTDSLQTLADAELVFAGYGVVAPEYQWNDYENLNVKGKVVLVMVNDPGFWAGDTSLFKGKTMTYYGRWTYKFEEAARQGAKGCLIIHNTAAASYPFSVQQNSFNTSRLQLDTRGLDTKNCDFIGWIPEAIANKLFNAAGFDSSLLMEANVPGFKPVPLNLKLSTTMKVASTYNKSYNVIGKITGTKYPDEVIIYSAHWDHLGVGKPNAAGDSIYNGALDNATGTAGLLELARAFSSMTKKPERTIVFLAVTSEEQGLMGSAYYAKNPVFPISKTVANINIDGLNPSTVTRDIVVLGEGQSELEDYLKEEIEKDSGYISFDGHPEAGFYYRSDHFNFAKAGVPALFIKTGTDVIGKGKTYGEELQKRYTANDYHQPSDQYHANSWTMEGAIRDLKILFGVGKRMAYGNVWPRWKEGSEFKAIREKSLETLN